MSNLNSKSKKNTLDKYAKPTQAIYRPPSARLESSSFERFSTPDLTFSSVPNYQNENFRLNVRLQQGNSMNYGNIGTNAFPIKGVLKRSKSFGNNNNRNSSDFESSLLDESVHGRFLLSMEGLSWENLTLIKQALDKNNCASLSMTQLLQIIRILCNRVLEKPTNAKIIAQVCMEIHYKQQISMVKLSDHKYLFIESLFNCLREWFNERDKLRFTTGGARRWAAYTLFIMEIYLNLRENVALNNLKHLEKDLKINEYSDADDTDDECSNSEDNSADDEVSRSFSNELSSDSKESIHKLDNCDKKIKKKASRNIGNKIINSLMSKQQKQFSNLLIDTFQVILFNPNSTPAEIECMQTSFRKCGKYLDQDNHHRIKALIFIIRDCLLNCSSSSPFVNCSSSNNSSITKNLLEIIELAASDWQFSQAQQIFYFPYTKID